jgi:hypothetical protein
MSSAFWRRWEFLVATLGRPRLELNVHRVYDHEAFARYFALVEFALNQGACQGPAIVAQRQSASRQNPTVAVLLVPQAGAVGVPAI